MIKKVKEWNWKDKIDWQQKKIEKKKLKCMDLGFQTKPKPPPLGLFVF